MAQTVQKLHSGAEVSGCIYLQVHTNAVLEVYKQDLSYTNCQERTRNILAHLNTQEERYCFITSTINKVFLKRNFAKKIWTIAVHTASQVGPS